MKQSVVKVLRSRTISPRSTLLHEIVLQVGNQYADEEREKKNRILSTYAARDQLTKKKKMKEQQQQKIQ